MVRPQTRQNHREKRRRAPRADAQPVALPAGKVRPADGTPSAFGACAGGAADGRQAVAQLAERVIGPLAGAALQRQFRELDTLQLPACLTIEKRQPRRITPGVAMLRQPAIRRYIGQAFRYLAKKRAA